MLGNVLMHAVSFSTVFLNMFIVEKHDHYFTQGTNTIPCTWKCLGWDKGMDAEGNLEQESGW